MEDDPYDQNDLRTAVTFGNSEVIGDWVGVQKRRGNRARVTRWVLFPAALYGQLDILKDYLQFGDTTAVDFSATYRGWTIYHYAIKGLEMNHPEVQGEPVNADEAPVAVWKTQLDIINVLGQSRVLLARRAREEEEEEEEEEEKDYPPLPSQMALDCDFYEAAILLDIYAVTNNENVPTPALDDINLTSPLAAHRSLKKGLISLIQWAYERRNIMVLSFCHKQYISLTSELIILHNKLPLFLDAVKTQRMDVMELVLNSESNRSASDRIFSQVYNCDTGRPDSLGDSAISMACQLCLNGNTLLLRQLLATPLTSQFLVHLSLSELGLRRVPLELFHDKLLSLTLSRNNLSQLPPVERWRCRGLLHLNLAENAFTRLPDALFQLPKLKDLNISDNQIANLNPCMWMAPNLRSLNVSSNQLKQFPCPARPQDKEGEGGGGRGPNRSSGGTEAPEVQYSVRHEFIDINFERDEDFLLTRSGHNLETLDASSNQLSSLPSGLPCLAPMLLSLKLNKNSISDLGLVSDYPPGLKSLDLSSNGAKLCIRPAKLTSTPVCYQPLLTDPQTNRKCSHAEHTHLPSLHYLNLSCNKLKTLLVKDLSLVPNPITAPMSGQGTEPVPPVSPTHKEAKEHDGVLFPKLQTLLVKKNSLTEVSENLHALDHLCSLDISENASITHLPSSISHLKNLFSFNFAGISDPIVNELQNCQNACEILYYLRARETGAILNASMRLFVIGHFQKGKTSLLNALQSGGGGRGRALTASLLGGPLDPKNSPPSVSSTIGIECSKWVCLKKKAQTKITFYTWDFAGQMDYYVTHHCFLSNRALYLLVWKLTDGEVGIESLRVWLKNLQARAPGASVIIVGTHFDTLKKNVAKGSIDQLLTMYRNEIDEKYGLASSCGKGAPVIKAVHFVSCTDKTMFTGPTGIEQLNDIIYDVAMAMEAPRSGQPAGYHMRVLDEKIPESYLRLQDYITHVVENDDMRNENLVVDKAEFCNRGEVQDIIGTPKEVEAAMNFLHNNVGIVLYFKKPMLEDFYILNPQWWFDACALVTAPDNVSSLVTHGNDPASGLLKIKLVFERFREKGYNAQQMTLIFCFLMEFGVIMRVDKEVVLLPSMIRSTPVIKLGGELGIFPYGNNSVDEGTATMLKINAMAPEADLRSLPSELKAQRTGLVFRRMLIIPSLPSGFWSKLICLCLQKDDFMNIVGEVYRDSSMRLGANRLIRIIGSSVLSLVYWKTGLVFYLDESLLLRINSLFADEFIDPMERATISETRSKVSRFYQHVEGRERQMIDPGQSDVIEILVPEVNLRTARSYDKTMSSKLLGKALEIVDEVLKGHCEMLTDDGIYTMDAMSHVIPCPICFGDRDNRPPLAPHLRPAYSPPEFRGRVTSDPHYRRFQQARRPMRHQVTTPAHHSPSLSRPPVGSIVVFPVDQCIRASLSGKYIFCPEHGHLDLERLAPDILFDDMSEVKLKRENLRDPDDHDGSPIGTGCYGVVYHKILKSQIGSELVVDIEGVLVHVDDNDLHVAVKEFKAQEGESDQTAELMKTYSDMRYELNKLNMLHHRHVVKFVGLLTQPRSFVLEWAPLKSLDSIRRAHAQCDTIDHLCPCSLYLVLMQVADGLAYLHRPPVGIIHNDVKLSNILAYRFPPIGHTCCTASYDRGRCSVALPDVDECGVLVKLGDLGVSTNPGSHSTRSLIGLKRLTPECIMFEAHITEKVDIFCLASCLFELMTLRGLPPRGMSEQDFKGMIKKGKRPKFHVNDPIYPLPLYLCLNQCWEQEHSQRPSAAKLRQFLTQMTTVSPSTHFQLHSPNMDQLLESFVFPEGSASAVCVLPEPSLRVCLAIKQFTHRTQVDSTNVLLACEEQNGGTHGVLRTQLVQHIMEPLISVHITSNMEYIMGSRNGGLTIVSKEAIPQRIQLSRQCQTTPTSLHGSLTYMHYIEQLHTLVMGFSSGQLHVLSITDVPNLSNVFNRGFCGAVENKQDECTGSFIVLYPMPQSPSSAPSSTVMEIWCGHKHNRITVWQFSNSDHAKQWRAVQPTQKTIRLQHNVFTSPSSCVTKMVASKDGRWVYCLVTDWMRAGALCLMDVTGVNPGRYMQCSNCVTTITVTDAMLLLGTAQGQVQMYPITPDNPLPLNGQQKCRQLICHAGPVHTISLIKGYVSPEGYTSHFRTFLGRQSKQMGCEYLITVGAGCVDINSGEREGGERGGGGGEGGGGGGGDKSSCCLSAWLV